MSWTITGDPVALCDTQHAGKEIVTRPMSEYFANDPQCHDLLPCTLRSHRVAGLVDVPQGRLWVESLPRRLRPCAVLWPCIFCSDRSTRRTVNYSSESESKLHLLTDLSNNKYIKCSHYWPWFHRWNISCLTSGPQSSRTRPAMSSREMPISVDAI